MQPVRGTHDLLPDEYRRFAHVIDTARDVARLYGYREMATPIFEFTELFARGIGETTDVVSKEMYTFQDRGGESLTLRPEYTAGICRAFVSNGELAQQLPLKLFAAGPMFRYERPQKGRQRQFHQIDLEVLGAPEPRRRHRGDLGRGRHPRARWASSIAACSRSTRWATRRAAPPIARCWSTITPATSASCPRKSRDRLQRNPLRILDSKDEGDKAINRQCAVLRRSPEPGQPGFLRGGAGRLWPRPACRSRSIPRWCAASTTTRHTAFEFVTTHLGAQGTVLGGGRYDGLIAELGGPPTAGIGWAGGIERLAMMLATSRRRCRGRSRSRRWATAAEASGARHRSQTLRRAGIAVEQDYRGNMKRRMQRANKLDARAAVIIGDDELAKGVAQLKDLDSGEQREVALAELGRSRLSD